MDAAICFLPLAWRDVMSVAVPSDGSVQKMFEAFLTDFDTLSDAKIKKAITWFSEAKENGRERLDDVNLPLLVKVGAKFYERYGDKAKDTPPAVIKKYMYIKLLQGKTSWEKKCQSPPSTDPKPWD